MKKLFRKIAFIDRAIAETKDEIELTRKLPFFSLFRKEETREAEISQMNRSLKEYYSQKHAFLESLELEIRKEKMRISSKERLLTLGRI